MESAGKIVLVGNEFDVLHAGYLHPIKDAGKIYPSVAHYAHSSILSQLGLDESALLELLCTPSVDVPARATQLLRMHMPAGHDMNSLASYLQKSRQSYTMQGLRLRVDQDEKFEQALMATRDSLLVVCDARDAEMGVGMDEGPFVDWMHAEKCDATMLAHWMQDELMRPPRLGENQLGFLLMWVRQEQRIKSRDRLVCPTLDDLEEVQQNDDDDGDDADRTLKIRVSQQIIVLRGIFRPLSNYYELPVEMKGRRYRSVEHYAYEKLLGSLKLGEKQIEKIRTTASPSDIPVVALRTASDCGVTALGLQLKYHVLEKKRSVAMAVKFQRSIYLQQLLLATGTAILVDTSLGDPDQTCASTTEYELQNLLAKRYITSKTLVDWMCGRPAPGKDVIPCSVSHLVGNRVGRQLMEMRAKLMTIVQERISLLGSYSSILVSSMVSPHIVCFTAESVFHPLYPAEVRPQADAALLPSPMHYVALQAAKALGLSDEEKTYVMEERDSVTCWQRMHETIEFRARGLEKEQDWWMEGRQRAIRDALTLLFEQHAPLLRALLDTGDALLVYCARPSSVESELSIGMRERDLRAWLNLTDTSSRQLLDFCQRPLAFRPTALGGNRLGLILMELRRDFLLRGVYPPHLPLLSQLTSEQVLGTDSAMEDLDFDEGFSSLDKTRYGLIFNNPLLILEKLADQDERVVDALMNLSNKSRRSVRNLLAVGRSTKTCPKLARIDELVTSQTTEDPAKIQPKRTASCPSSLLGSNGDLWR